MADLEAAPRRVEALDVPFLAEVERFAGALFAAARWESAPALEAVVLWVGVLGVVLM